MEAPSGLGALGANDVDVLAATLGAELDGTGGQGEQGVVLAAADADARVELGATLADQDLAGADDLAADVRARCLALTDPDLADLFEHAYAEQTPYLVEQKAGYEAYRDSFLTDGSGVAR